MTTSAAGVWSPDADRAEAWRARLPDIERKLADGSFILVFVVGMARSGTTWLARLLGEHPLVVDLYETHLFNTHLSGSSKVFGVPDEQRTKRVGVHLACPEETFLEGIRQLVLGTLFHSVADRPRCILVEKTPANYHHLPFIRTVLPEARLVLLTRDPRAVVASWHAAGATWARRWARHSTVSVARHWNGIARGCERLARESPLSWALTYEQLHADPATELRRLLGWLGIAATAEECQAAAQACAFDRLRGKPAAAHGIAPHLFFRRGETEGWRKDLSSRQIACIEQVAKRQMARLGYTRVRDSAARGPSAWVADAMAACEIAVRRRLWRWAA